MNRFGDGLLTLLLLALGLGCLNLVFHGLMDGAVGGGGGASFAFATKPVKFVLIELFWLGLGLLFLFGAWRGVSRKRMDGSDGADEDDDATQPARLVVAPSATPVPLPTASRSLKPAKPEAMTPAAIVAKAVPPAPLELFNSRPYAVLVVVVFTLFLGSSVYTAMALATILGKIFMVIFIAPTFILYIATMAQCFRNFFWTGPVLVLDKFGIRNFRKGGHLVPWTEVDAVRLDARNASTYLVLRFRNAGDVQAHFGLSRWLQALARRLIYRGFEGRMKLTSLAFSRPVVLKAAQEFLRYSRR